MIVLINDILDLAKVDSGKMTFEQVPFKMTTSISAMLGLFETIMGEKNLELEKEYDNKIPEVLIGDPVRFHQIILNLVNNAVKFTEKGKITISARLLNENPQKATIEFAVTDTGIGIPEDKINLLFQNFQQVSTGTSRLYGGTGLGLAIVKQLVESQQGTITVKSKPGEGSTFSFILDFQKTNAKLESATKIPEQPAESENIRVLVVEDVELNRLLMKALLDDFGFEMEFAENGKVAIEKLQAQAFDIILMDLHMPVMNGFEATKYIRETINSSIPILALTADATMIAEAKCRNAAMNGYLSKPIDEKLLYRKIIALVKKPGLKKNHIPTLNGNGNSNASSGNNRNSPITSTKPDPKLMMEMISLYLKQTPSLINTMKQSLKAKDWNSLQEVAHKMIPSFSTTGISKQFEDLAKKAQEHATAMRQTSEGMSGLLIELEKACTQICLDLEQEFNIIKNGSDEIIHPAKPT